MWNPASGKSSSPIVKEIKPDRIFCEHGEPLTFTAGNLSGAPLFFHWCDHEGDRKRYLATPTKHRLLKMLERGEVTILEVLTEGRLWLIEVDEGMEVVATWEVRADELPGDYLPDPDVLLHEGLRP